MALLLVGELGVERDVAARVVDAVEEGAGLTDAVHPVHAVVLPLHAERALVLDLVQRAADRFPVHLAATRGTELPAAAGAAEREVTVQQAVEAVLAAGHVLDVHVVDELAELEQEGRRVDALPQQVARVEVDPKRLPPFDSCVVESRERGVHAPGVEADLGRVHFEVEAQAELRVRVDDRPEPRGEVGEARHDLTFEGRRELVDQRPDGRAGESGHVRAVHLRRRLADHDQPLGGPLSHAFRVAVAPDRGRQDRLMARLDVVADGLADQVAGHGDALEAVLGEECLAVSDVAVAIRQVLIDVEELAPGGQFHGLVAGGGGDGEHLVVAQVGELTEEQ